MEALEYPAKSKETWNNLTSDADILEDFGVKLVHSLVLSQSDFFIPGSGEKPDYCGKWTVASICGCGSSIGTAQQRCKTSACPDCCTSWIQEKAFDLAYKIIAYSRISGEDPAHIISSINPRSTRDWTWDNYTTFFRRTYRRLAKLGAVGGVRFYHPFRIKKQIKKRLHEHGFGKGGEHHFWYAVRHNSLNLPSWRDYIDFSPHAHCIVFPSFLEPHSNPEIVIKKVRSLESDEQIIKTCLYLLSHVGSMRVNQSRNEPVVAFGALHRFKPEKHLEPSQILEIKDQIANFFGKVYDPKKEKMITPKAEPANCRCGTPETDFISLTKFRVYNEIDHDYLHYLFSDLEYKNQPLFDYLFHKINSEDYSGHVYVSDILRYLKWTTIIGMPPPAILAIYFSKFFKKKHK